MSHTLDVFNDNRKKGESTHLVDDFEGAAFRFTPNGDTYRVYIKWKGREEKPIDKTERIVCDSLLGGRVISKIEYGSY